ncbi:2775_t:CDS:2 [Gigaspora margarita]|uniref:2775_t:CDS:1 n=1 Tax=Gigaspora margarita TaxID=4874 RepID=A0ABM8W340_GIGMA|nr:2775_t:CDS:2 [Gigaspora margarita]
MPNRLVNCQAAVVDITPYEEQLNFTVQSIKNFSRNCEVERSAAILHGVLLTFDEAKKIRLHIEYSLSDANGKGRFDFSITWDEDILCVAEVKKEDIEYGLITTGDKWYFSVVTTDNKIGTTDDPLYLHLDSNEEILKEDISALFKMVLSILLYKIKSIEEPQTKFRELITF